MAMDYYILLLFCYIALLAIAHMAIKPHFDK